MNTKKKLLFFGVNTQIDFIENNGVLYVPEAGALKTRFKQLIRYARINRIPTWGSVDSHSEDDPELIQNTVCRNLLDSKKSKKRPRWIRSGLKTGAI